MLLSGQPQPASPVVLPPRSPTCVSPHAHPPVLAGAAGVARLVGVARVLGLGVHGLRTPRLVALQGHRLGPSGGPPCHLLQHWLLQAKGHLQEINRHPEGLYFAGQVGLSQRKSSGAPEEKKQLVGVGLELSVGSEQRGRPCPGSSLRKLRGASLPPENAPPPRLLLSPVSPVPPALPPRKSSPRLCPGVGKMTAKATQNDPTLDPLQGRAGQHFPILSQERGTWVLARPTGWSSVDHSRRQLASVQRLPQASHLLPFLMSECPQGAAYGCFSWHCLPSMYVKHTHSYCEVKLAAPLKAVCVCVCLSVCLSVSGLTCVHAQMCSHGQGEECKLQITW